jgi:hypothetical protein
MDVGMNVLTQTRVREVLAYDRKTGVFVWRVTKGRAVAGSIAGRIDSTGHRQLTIDSKRYGAHRVAWLYETGSFPLSGLDHINCDKTDNRMDNLREATCSQNQHNVGAQSRNKTGMKGVCVVNGKYLVQATKGGRLHQRGPFADPSVAFAVACSLREQLHGQFARHG